MAANYSEDLSIIAPDVMRAIRFQYDESDRAAVIAALKRCHTGPDDAQVHRAILVLSADCFRDVEKLVETAKEDPRDLLSGAETDPWMVERYHRLGLRPPTGS